MSSEMPTVRWGIIATGKISQWFVTDLLQTTWPSKRANHIIQSIGASSLTKAQTFVKTYMASAPSAPRTYGSYAEVYNDPDVDVVYIGTPHSFHKRCCLDAIAAGKHVLCEKPFMLNLNEAKEVIAAAKAKGVFLMEAMWTRFFPLVKELRRLLFEKKIIGDILRTFSDFGMDMDLDAFPDTSYYKSAAMGAGSLLDVGVYSLTWGLLTLEDKVGEEEGVPEVVSQQTVKDGIDVASTMAVHYPSTGRQGVLSSTTKCDHKQPFCTVYGEKGNVEIEGMPSGPDAFIFKLKDGTEERYDFPRPGYGFFWEADAVAWCLKEGKLESDIMPHSETERVMGILDGVRRRGGARFPVDDW